MLIMNYYPQMHQVAIIDENKGGRYIIYVISNMKNPTGLKNYLQ